MLNLIKVISLFLLSFAIVSCSGKSKTTGSTDSSSDSGDSTAPGLATDSPLYLQVHSKWEAGTETYVEQVTCAVDAAAAVGTAITCEVSIPEGQLFFSNLKFTVGTSDAAKCPILIFRPYYYRMSTSATFPDPFDPSGADLDCSDGTNAKCYNGPAVLLSPSFPTYTGMYFLTTSALSKSWSLDSASSLGKNNNTFTANNLLTANRGTADYGGVPYVANSLRDYVFACEDSWSKRLYQITLTISDEDDSESDPNADDDFYDWN